MPVIFPGIETVSEEGLIAIGGDLEIETLITAYKQGIFPWPISKETPLTWFTPEPRGILMIKDFHLSKSFKKFLSKTNFSVKFNHDFRDVITNCSKVTRKHESDTWISQDIIDAYQNMFEHGLAYCVSVYNEDKLVGGLYGVCIGKIISGESMFHLEDNASKFALYSLIEKLKLSSIEWIDTQMVTPIIGSFGGKEISRDYYFSLLDQIKNEPCLRKDLFGC